MSVLSEKILLLDGATGTEINRRGVDISLPLWSARALLEAPEIVEQIHIDYLEAGSDAIITNSFRTHERSLAKADLGDRAEELTRFSVDIAKSARDKVKPDALILGSVAPLEDCYHPELSPSIDECRSEHSRIMEQLLDAGVDYLMIETVSSRREALAAAETAKRLAPGKWLMSFCMKATGPPGVLLHGPPVVDVLPTMSEAYAVGVNCMNPASMTEQIRLLRKLLPDAVRISAYGNIGYLDDEGRWRDRGALSADEYTDFVEQWIETGATIVGGCCGTTPEVIAAVAKRLGKAAM